MSYLHANTHLCYAFSSNFIIRYSFPWYVHKAQKSTLPARVHRAAPSASRPRCEWTRLNCVKGQPFIVSSHWVPRGWGFEVRGGGWVRCQEEKVSWSFKKPTATMLTYLDTMRPLLMLTSCWLTGHNRTHCDCSGMQCEIQACILCHARWNSLIYSVGWWIHLMKRLPFEPTVTRGR